MRWPREQIVPMVHTIVRLVPPGRVVSYGDIAGMLDASPRAIGRYLATSGDEPGLPWWRVVSASGDLAPHLRDAAFARWADEGITPKPGGTGCRIAEHRADLALLADRAEAALGPLPGVSG